jgi:SRSO17 transposase
MRAEEWLLIEWPEGEAEPLKYFLSTAPADATIEQLVFVTKMRWRIERDYQELKQEFGLSHYEGRGWCEIPAEGSHFVFGRREPLKFRQIGATLFSA